MRALDGMNIDIRIDDPQGVYKPGDHIAGSVVLQNRESWEAKYADVILGWRTSGRGDEDSVSVQTIQLYTESEMVSPRVEKRFSFRIPKLPWTYHGHLIKLDWLLGVYIKARGSKEISKEKIIYVHPSWQADPNASPQEIP